MNVDGITVVVVVGPDALVDEVDVRFEVVGWATHNPNPTRATKTISPTNVRNTRQRRRLRRVPRGWCRGGICERILGETPGWGARVTLTSTPVCRRDMPRRRALDALTCCPCLIQVAPVSGASSTAI